MAPDTDHRPIRAHAPAPRRRRARLALASLTVAVAALAAAVPAASAPDATARPVPVAGPAEVAGPVRHTTAAAHHLVEPGETLSGIARRHGVAVAALVEANGIADPDLIRHGVTLVVPATGVGGGSDGAGLPDRLVASPERLALRPAFARWADANGIPTDLLEAVAWLESGWQASLVSSDGAIGIGQLMPSTVTFMEELIGVDLDPYVAGDNIRMAARYLRWLLARTTSVEGALAGYYQGLSSVEANGRYGETDRYVANVLALRERF